MITEDYVSFETAKLLKEKGFVEECRAFYVKSKECGIELFYAKEPNNYNDNVLPCTSAPTLQMAMKWLREKHKIFISIQQHMDMSYVWYSYEDGAPKGCDRESHNNTYEQACEAAIKYCLEKLI